MKDEFLYQTVDRQFRRLKVPPRRFTEFAGIGVAFPQALPPGYHMYHLESAADRSPCGIAAASISKDQESWELCATTGADTLFSRVRIEKRSIGIETTLNSDRLGAWHGSADGDEGRWESEAGGESIEVRECEARWRNSSGETTRFRLTGPASLGEVVLGVSRGLSALVTGGEQRSQDIVWMADRTGFEVFAMILTLRMCIFTYDFSP
jgi:hypothetical protein